MQLIIRIIQRNIIRQFASSIDANFHASQGLGQNVTFPLLELLTAEQFLDLSAKRSYREVNEL